MVQPLGWCTERMELVTEWHPFGSAQAFEEALVEAGVPPAERRWRRLDAALDYVRAIAYLHDSPLGTRVMCDQNTVDKALSQFLITSQLRLKLADVDALPEVVRAADGTLIHGVRCGHRRIGGGIVAPEQHWPYDDRAFVDDEMPEYDERVDVYKIPFVVEAILLKRASRRAGPAERTAATAAALAADHMAELTHEYGEEFARAMQTLHTQCAARDPADRIGAADALAQLQAAALAGHTANP